MPSQRALYTLCPIQPFNFNHWSDPKALDHKCFLKYINSLLILLLKRHLNRNQLRSINYLTFKDDCVILSWQEISQLSYMKLFYSPRRLSNQATNAKEFDQLWQCDGETFTETEASVLETKIPFACNYLSSTHILPTELWALSL